MWLIYNIYSPYLIHICGICEECMPHICRFTDIYESCMQCPFAYMILIKTIIFHMWPYTKNTCSYMRSATFMYERCHFHTWKVPLSWLNIYDIHVRAMNGSIYKLYMFVIYVSDMIVEYGLIGLLYRWPWTPDWPAL